MVRSITLARALLVLGLLASSLALPGAASAANRKHHLSLNLGYQKYLSDDLKPIVDLGGGPTQLDFTNAGVGTLAYRFSLRPNLDLALDLRGAASKDNVGGVDVTLTSSYFGPGIRLVGAEEGVRPFVQANLYLVDESIEFKYQNVKVTGSDNGVGFGVTAGADIRASDLISIPIQAEFVYAKPADDVTGIGATVGITFNFGELH
ncbi:MAG TPA: outer membrane beta-barrel protein [Candidatus Eisenbacteria bacterium]|nr:outer membrane beta-barrel protein [Candidatus Eisenbacteria bacterium]